MSEGKFESALNALQKDRDPKTLLKVLIFVRKEVEWPKNKENICKLREKGCLKQVVENLHSNQKSVIDVCLSILGNCLMDKSCSRTAVVQFNILSVINQLLKKLGKEDSINGRVFRIIGNLCQHTDQWSNIIVDRKPNIIKHIVEFVKKVSKDELPADEKISDATIIMSLKALREMLNSTTIMSLVKNFGVLKAVGALFIKYSLRWQESKENEKLLIDIIRLLQEYSRYKFYHSILEMRNTERGDSLVHLSSVLMLAPRKIVKIIMNFIRISQLKSELPIPEICDKFIEVLENNSIIREFDGDFVEYLQCLCYLLEHPGNRSSDRCGKSIPLLIKLLKDFKEPTNTSLECCTLLISTLIKCKYDDELLLMQLHCSVVEILVEKLHWLVGPSKILNVKHKDERKRTFSERFKNYLDMPKTCVKKIGLKYDVLRQPLSPVSSDDELDMLNYTKFTRSPSPCSSTDSDNALSWSSPCSSPTSVIEDPQGSDSDDYSPVCSEVDPSEFPLPENDEELVTEADVSSDMLEIEENMATEDKNTSMSLKVRMLSEITKLIRAYAKLRPVVPQLASEDLFFALLKCSSKFENSYSIHTDSLAVLCQMLETHDYVLPLMLTDFVRAIYDLTEVHSEVQHGSWCARCSYFKFLGSHILRLFTHHAESGVGKGDIAHKLLRGDARTKELLVLNIPLIVRNRSILGKLMLNCGGLDVLIRLLRDDTTLKNRSITVVCAMAKKKLEIANPLNVTSNGLNRPIVIADRYKTLEPCVKTVTFKLDDGSSLVADRGYLSEKSDFFDSLLNGHFRESTKSEIDLHNVELKSFRCLLHLSSIIDKSETVAVDLDLETLLDVILLADRYLMEDLCAALTNSVEQFRISSGTVPVIYKWSLESGTNLLRVESIAFALVANVRDEERYKMFESLFDLGYKSQLLDDIQKLLVRYLSISVKF